MKEEEAKTKWCPHVRQETTDEPATAINRTYDGKDYNCIASDCMMWKWDAENEAAYFNSEGGIPAQGYCGLIKEG